MYIDLSSFLIITKKGKEFCIILNMISAALISNKEWNTKNVFTEQGEVVRELISEFEQF